ncbi:MAG: ABC transporter ATP-binding protein [Lachnospiraceae bacterium]|nr:ABC transporter ATP-binding protein [Lachnospiraceae bacterium]
MIEVKDLVKRYGTHTALDHLTFTIEDGGIYGLLGPNGAGKSTTMNILTGYLCANEGTVTVNGHDILKDTEKAKAEIGYLPEMPPLYEDMTVREYLEFVCELKKINGAKIPDEIKRVSEKTGIADVEERLIRNLSKGYKQRVGIAQALIASPSIIILDEPTVGLDPLQIIEIRDLIRELKSEHTVILSSHILSEVSAVCDEILIISNGRLVAKDSAENLGRLSEGKHLLRLCVKGDRKQIEAVLADFDQIQECRMEEGSEGIRLELSLSEGKDIREDLFYRFADEHLPILEMSMEHASLEEVFIDLTKDEADNTENQDNTENEQEAAES